MTTRLACSAAALALAASAHATQADLATPGSLLLTPDAGHDLVLEAFMLTGRGTGDAAPGRVRVLDTTGRVLWDSGDVAMSPGMFIGMDCEPIRSALPLRIEVRSFQRLGWSSLAIHQLATGR